LSQLLEGTCQSKQFFSGAVIDRVTKKISNWKTQSRTSDEEPPENSFGGVSLTVLSLGASAIRIQQGALDLFGAGLPGISL